ncbi:hypothetical protein SH2C18_39580 [Clostridium sediminicola]
MADVNIQIKQKNGEVWDNLYPKTKAMQVVTNSGDTVEQHTGDTTVHITSSERSNWNAKATTQYVVDKITELVNSSPSTLDTLNELAQALGNDPNFATTITNALGNKFDKTNVDASTALGTSNIKVPSQNAVKTYVANQLSSSGYGDMMKATYDSNNDGKIDIASFAESAAIKIGDTLPAEANAGEIFFQTIV